MKHVLLLSLSIYFVSVQAVSSQITLKTRPFYLGAGVTYPLGPVIKVGGYHTNGWGGVLVLHAIWTNAQNQPVDYSPGLRLYNDNLKDKAYWGSVRVMKLIPTSRKRLKYGLEAGPTWIQTVSPTNFKRVTSNALFSSNYSYLLEKKNALGLSFRGEIVYSLNKWSSIELGFNAILNKLRAYYGLDLIATIGYDQW